MTARTILTHRRRSGGRAWAGLALMGVLAALWLAVASQVHVNASWSDDAWGYLVLPIGEPAIGDTVLFEPPASAGARTPYLKTVRGLPGAVLTVDTRAVDTRAVDTRAVDTRAVDAGRTVRIDGAPVARAKSHALDGRPLVAVAPGVVPDGHYYLHADHPDSHDSRYAEIGPVPRERILGRAVALPDIPWLGLEGPLVGPEDARRKLDTLVPETRR